MSLGEIVMYCGLKGLFLMCECPHVGSMSLVIFVKGCFSMDVCLFFLRCMLSITPLIGVVTGAGMAEPTLDVERGLLLVVRLSQSY